MAEGKKQIDYRKIFDKVINVLIGLYRFLKECLKIVGRIIFRYILILSKKVYEFVLKNYKERWFQITTGVLVVLILIPVLFSGGKDVPFEERTEDFETVLEYNKRDITVIAKDLGIEVLLPEEFVASEMDLTIEPVNTVIPSWAIDAFMFDISLEDKHMLPGVVEMTISYDKSLVPKDEDASEYVSAMHLNNGTWKYVYYEVDERDGEVLIKTDHFSTFGIFLGDNHPESKTIEPLITNRKVDNINLDRASTDGVALAWTEVNRYMGIAGKVGSFTDGVVELTEEGTKSISFIQGSKALQSFNDLLDNYGKGVFVLGLAQSVYEGKTDQAVFNTIKHIGETMIGSFSTSVAKFGGAAMFAIDYSLGEFTKAAFDGAEKNWERTYNHYYNDSEYMGRDALYWRNFILEIYDANPAEDYFEADPYIDFINALIDKKIDEHLELIWNDLDTAYLAASDLNIGRLNVPSQTIKDKLEKNYKQELYQERIFPAFKSVNVILAERAELERANQMNKLVHDLTRDRTIFINSAQEGTYKITDGTNVLIEGTVPGEAVYTLEDYIALNSNNLYLEVTLNGEITRVVVPEGFPTRIYMTVEISTSKKTRDEILEEEELDFDQMFDTLEEKEMKTYELITDNFDTVLANYSHDGANGEIYYSAEVNGVTMTIEETHNTNEFGYDYETLYYVSYSNSIRAYLDEDLEIVALYTMDQNPIDISSWSGEIDSKSIVLPNGDKYSRIFDDGEMRREEYYRNTGLFEVIYKNGDIEFVRENGIIIYPN